MRVGPQARFSNASKKRAASTLPSFYVGFSAASVASHKAHGTPRSRNGCPVAKQGIFEGNTLNLDEFLSGALNPSFSDARTTLEASLGDSVFGEHLATRIAYAVALATAAHRLAAVLGHTLDDSDRVEAEAAVAGVTMASTYAAFAASSAYPELQQSKTPLSLSRYSAAVAADPVTLEALGLAVSIAHRCPTRITLFVDYLKERGFTLEQFKNLAQITAAVCAISHSGRA